MSQGKLLPHIYAGIANMKPEEAFSFTVRLSSAMIAGVALLAGGLSKSHPVRRCSVELIAMMPHTDEDASRVRTNDLIELLETAGTLIWRLVQFQPEGELKAKLIQLVEFVCPPAALAVEP